MMSLALIVALALGLSGNFPDIKAEYRSNTTILILAVMMTFALSRIPFRGMNPLEDKKSSARAFLLGVMLASTIPLALSFFFDDHAYKIGLVFIGLTPFAASVVPLSYIMRGDMNHAARGTLVVYFSALVYIPVIAGIILKDVVPLKDIVIAVVAIVLVPLLLSRLLHNVEIKKETMSIFLNFCVFFLVFLSVGASADLFFKDVNLLVIFMGIAAARTFGLGLILEYVERKKGIPWGQRVTDVLMVSYKNKGIAIAMVVAVATAAFGAGPGVGKALFPVTASIVIEICWVIFMDSVLLSPKRMERELEREGSPVVE